MGWRFHTTNPRFVAILTEAVFQLDPMNTACVENHSWDEYNIFSKNLDRKMGDADSNVLTSKMIEEVAEAFFGSYGKKRVGVFFSQKAESLFSGFLGATLLYDVGADAEIQHLVRMTAGDLEWGELETIAEFANTVATGMFCYGDECAVWVVERDGAYYQIDDVIRDVPAPAIATHVFWYGK